MLPASANTTPETVISAEPREHHGARPPARRREAARQRAEHRADRIGGDEHAGLRLRERELVLAAPAGSAPAPRRASCRRGSTAPITATSRRGMRRPAASATAWRSSAASPPPLSARRPGRRPCVAHVGERRRRDLARLLGAAREHGLERRLVGAQLGVALAHRRQLGDHGLGDRRLEVAVAARVLHVALDLLRACGRCTRRAGRSGS